MLFLEVCVCVCVCVCVYTCECVCGVWVCGVECVYHNIMYSFSTSKKSLSLKPKMIAWYIQCY